MIISHKHKFIFLKTRKTASSSLEMALSKICGQDDIISLMFEDDEKKKIELGLPSMQNTLVPFKYYNDIDKARLLLKWKRQQFYDHSTAKDVKEYVSSEVWNTYFKFAFDRNPFDKMVSLYYWRGGDKKYKSINAFLKSGVLESIRSFDLYSIHGIVAVDKLYKFEEMDAALSDISKQLNLSEPLQLPQYKAKAGIRKVRDYKEILDEDSIRLIEIAFAREIKYLQYQY